MTEQSLNFVHQRIRPASKLVLFVLLSVALMLLDNRYTPIRQAKSYVSTALYPLQWLVGKPVTSIESSMVYWQNQQTLAKQNTRINLENAQLRLQLQQQAAQIQALGGLASVAKLQQSALPKATVVQIISSGSSPFTDKFIINHGSRQGIQLGDPVTDAQGLVGQISAVQPFSAEVTLLTNSQTVVPAMISRTGVRTLIYGRSGGVDLRYFPSDASLQTKDLLVTSDMDSVYPAGIPIAEVVQVESGNGSPYYRVQLKPVADNRNSRFLLVVPQQQTAPISHAASDTSLASP